MDKWIPVSERLPKKDRKHNTFLVTDSNGNLSISKFYLPLSNSDIDKPYWSGMIDVIAWMPLPKPYEPQESEDKDADKKCTYKETGCGSCKRQLDCPIEADKAERTDA